MKIQALAIIFVILMLPITIMMSEYSATQRSIAALEQSYDSILTTATDDSLKAFQINTFNDATSDIADRKMNSIEASVNAFYNSMETGFGLQGYSKEDLKAFVPALVYTMYDGYYIYSPYQNIASTDKDDDKDTLTALNIDIESEKIQYGFKPYVYYSCRYNTASGDDFVITYTLDNYITVQGWLGGEIVDKSGYLITLSDSKAGKGLYYSTLEDKYYYNGIEITEEVALEEFILEEDGTQKENGYKYIKLNGTKYYLDESNEKIFYLLGGKKIDQATKAKEEDLYNSYKNSIEHNKSAIAYYRDAYNFTNWVEDNLSNLKTGDVTGNGSLQDDKNQNYKIFEVRNDNNPVEYPYSNFNTHRKNVIKYAIESNLSAAIANFNTYSDSKNSFQMPVLKETDWDMLENEIAIISFLQGLNLGGKIYNGYSVVTNAKTEELVKEERIYMTTTDGYYHKINDKHLVDGTYKKEDVPVGLLDLDFEIRKDGTVGIEYINRHEVGCYTSIVAQGSVDNTYASIYEYLADDKIDNQIKQKYYIALGREKWARRYNSLIVKTVNDLP